MQVNQYNKIGLTAKEAKDTADYPYKKVVGPDNQPKIIGEDYDPQLLDLFQHLIITPDNKLYSVQQGTRPWNDPILKDVMPKWEKDYALSTLKPAFGYKGDIRKSRVDPKTGKEREPVEYDHFVFSFSQEDLKSLGNDGAILTNDDLSDRAKIVMQTIIEEMRTSENSGAYNAKCLIEVHPIHTDTNNVHMHIIVNRMGFDTANKQIVPSVQMHEYSAKVIERVQKAVQAIEPGLVIEDVTARVGPGIQPEAIQRVAQMQIDAGSSPSGDIAGEKHTSTRVLPTASEARIDNALESLDRLMKRTEQEQIERSALHADLINAKSAMVKARELEESLGILEIKIAELEKNLIEKDEAILQSAKDIENMTAFLASKEEELEKTKAENKENIEKLQEETSETIDNLTKKHQEELDKNNNAYNLLESEKKIIEKTLEEKEEHIKTLDEKIARIPSLEEKLALALAELEKERKSSSELSSSFNSALKSMEASSKIQIDALTKSVGELREGYKDKLGEVKKLEDDAKILNKEKEQLKKNADPRISAIEERLKNKNLSKEEREKLEKELEEIRKNNLILLQSLLSPAPKPSNKTKPLDIAQNVKTGPVAGPGQVAVPVKGGLFGGGKAVPVPEKAPEIVPPVPPVAEIVPPAPAPEVTTAKIPEAPEGQKWNPDLEEFEPIKGDKAKEPEIEKAPDAVPPSMKEIEPPAPAPAIERSKPVSELPFSQLSSSQWNEKQKADFLKTYAKLTDNAQATHGNKEFVLPGIDGKDRTIKGISDFVKFNEEKVQFNNLKKEGLDDTAIAEKMKKSQEEFNKQLSKIVQNLTNVWENLFSKRGMSLR